ncbi:uncharacterized protein CBL_05370 [Carabus blaptoides fortunei]
MLVIVVLTLCALASGARLPTANLDGRIVGGMTTTIEEHPYQIVELADSEPTNTDIATVSGWGALASGGTYPTKLQFVEIPVIDRETCQKRYIKHDTITER